MKKFNFVLKLLLFAAIFLQTCFDAHSQEFDVLQRGVGGVESFNEIFGLSTPRTALNSYHAFHGEIRELRPCLKMGGAGGLPHGSQLANSTLGYYSHQGMHQQLSYQITGFNSNGARVLQPNVFAGEAGSAIRGYVVTYPSSAVSPIKYTSYGTESFGFALLKPDAKGIAITPAPLANGAYLDGDASVFIGEHPLAGESASPCSKPPGFVRSVAGLGLGMYAGYKTTEASYYWLNKAGVPEGVVSDVAANAVGGGAGSVTAGLVLGEMATATAAVVALPGVLIGGGVGLTIYAYNSVEEDSRRTNFGPVHYPEVEKSLGLDYDDLRRAAPYMYREITEKERREVHPEILEIADKANCRLANAILIREQQQHSEAMRLKDEAIAAAKKEREMREAAAKKEWEMREEQRILRRMRAEMSGMYMPPDINMSPAQILLMGP